MQFSEMTLIAFDIAEISDCGRGIAASIDRLVGKCKTVERQIQRISSRFVLLISRSRLLVGLNRRDNMFVSTKKFFDTIIKHWWKNWQKLTAKILWILSQFNWVDKNFNRLQKGNHKFFLVWLEKIQNFEQNLKMLHR